MRVDLPALEKTVKDERKEFWKEKQAKAKERAKKVDPKANPELSVKTTAGKAKPTKKS